MQVDHLIVGQGLSGTLLSYYLLREGKSVMVIDDGDPAISSKVAAGVINPVTGKRLVRTWMIEELLPFAQDAYTVIENELDVALVQECDILDLHLTQEMSDIFHEKQPKEAQYLHHVSDESKWTEYFRFNYGISKISPCLLVDLATLLSSWRERLQEDENLLEQRFSWDDVEVRKDKVFYKDITAGNIIMCNGAGCNDDPYFNLLPWSKDKGEALIASIPGLPRTHIYKHGVSIVPWNDDLFWIGATHDWKFTDMQLTPAFRKQTEEQLNYWLKLPYTIVDHIVAQRPANVERKPFVGFHPVHTRVGIFNGMGSKGCSVAPYFAHEFALHLAYGTPILPEVDIKRFTKILSR
jgi:glycine/D-amino acid oxidase-like deaminating enzyme